MVATLAAAPLVAVPTPQAPGCDASTATATLTDVAVDGNRVSAHSTWQVGGEADGATIELRTDSDGQLARTELRTSGELDWSIEFRPGTGLCGGHLLQLYVTPGLAVDDRTLSHCVGLRAVAKQPFTINCRPAVRKLTCDWRCAPDATSAVEWCDGLCRAEITPGLGPELPPWVPYWGTEGQDPVRGEPTVALTLEHQLSCLRGQTITLAMSASGRYRPSPTVTTRCGGN
jgi:hypothetical protein